LKTREKIIQELKEFYSKNHLNRNGFKCIHSLDCETETAKTNRIINFRGAQAHVGALYGEKLKIVVLSLDSGGGHDYIEERTETIESVIYRKANPHMRGTIEILRVLFPNESDATCLKRFAMTNSAKCSAGDSRDKLPSTVYEKCSGFHKTEIEILIPDLLISQGNDAYPYFLKPQKISDKEFEEFYELNTNSSPKILKAIQPTISRYCRTVEILNFKVMLINCPHPSSRNGQWQLFRDVSLPIVKLFIDSKYDNKKEKL
jgi:hypothetical protein